MLLSRALIVAAALAACRPETRLEPECRGDLVVNEVAAANDFSDVVSADFCVGHATDSCCESPDWFEVYNTTGHPIDLADYLMAITYYDGDTLDHAMVPEHGFAIVLALPYDEGPAADCSDALDVPVIVGTPDFDRDGYRVLLRGPTFEICEDFAWGDTHSSASWGRVADGGPRCTHLLPTPGRSNVPLGGEDVPCDAL